MSDQTKEKQTLSTGQVTFLFLIFVSMLFAIFAVGVCIGKWSQPTVDRKIESRKTANISFIESNPNSGGNTGASQESSTEAARQSIPGTPLSMPVDESKITKGYAVQVATMATMEEANGLLTQLRRDGLTQSYVRVPDPGSVLQLYSVELGQFDDTVHAEQVIAQLKGRGLSHSRIVQIYSDRKANIPSNQGPQVAPAAP